MSQPLDGGSPARVMPATLVILPALFTSYVRVVKQEDDGMYSKELNANTEGFGSHDLSLRVI